MAAGRGTPPDPAERPAQDRFPSTRWSRILTPPQDAKDARTGDLEALAEAYWQPVCAWLRSQHALRAEDAADATQDFFAWILESDLLSRADPERGRFRPFLKTALRNFTIDRTRRRAAQRRGGGRAPLPLPELVDTGPASPGRSADEVLDEAWRHAEVSRAFERLDQEMRSSGHGTAFEVFRDYYLADDPALDYKAVAARHGTSESNVSNLLKLAKRRFREILRSVAAETVDTPEDLELEMRWLLGGA